MSLTVLIAPSGFKECLVFQHLDLDSLLARADLVLTAEGSLDAQSPYGKVPAEVGRRAALLGVPVLALAGTIGGGATSNLNHGISAFSSILSSPLSLADAISSAPRLLAEASEQAIRTVGAGLTLVANRQRQANALRSLALEHERPPARLSSSHLTLVP